MTVIIHMGDYIQPEPPASGYTSHGWPYGPNPPTGPARVLAKCGGPGLCRTCSTEAGLPERAPAVAPDPMPVFTIKGKDRLAVLAVSAYARLCDDRYLTDQAAEVEMAMFEIEAWQSRHPELVKLPDHKHVPVDAQSVASDAQASHSGTAEDVYEVAATAQDADIVEPPYVGLGVSRTSLAREPRFRAAVDAALAWERTRTIDPRDFGLTPDDLNALANQFYTADDVRLEPLTDGTQRAKLGIVRSRLHSMADAIEQQQRARELIGRG